MAPYELEDALQALTISHDQPDSLLFRPRGDKAWLKEKFSDIPRYLFRVFTPNSCGSTNRSWTKSMAARRGAENSKLDIFERTGDKIVANMLNGHLRWWSDFEDNLVSWTSSLLFALVYVFHLHANDRDGSPFERIFLCVIDTTKFRRGVFLRDVDLIEAYSGFNDGLENLGDLRKSWYFGEYLSQGALKIENKCQIVSAKQMIDQGLYELRAEFEEFSRWQFSRHAPWVRPVDDLRATLCQGEGLEDSSEKVQVAIDIAKVFGTHWILPVAANLIALLPPQAEDTAIIHAFRSKLFTDDYREQASPLKTKVMVYDGLPEVEQFARILQIIYKDYCVRGRKKIQLLRTANLGTKQEMNNLELELLKSFCEYLEKEIMKKQVQTDDFEN